MFKLQGLDLKFQNAISIMGMSEGFISMGPSARTSFIEYHDDIKDIIAHWNIDDFMCVTKAVSYFMDGHFEVKGIRGNINMDIDIINVSKEGKDFLFIINPEILRFKLTGDETEILLNYNNTGTNIGIIKGFFD